MNRIDVIKSVCTENSLKHKHMQTRKNIAKILHYILLYLIVEQCVKNRSMLIINLCFLFVFSADMTQMEVEWKLQFNEWSTKYIVEWKTQFDSFLIDHGLKKAQTCPYSP